MADIVGTNVGSKIVPTDTADTFPTHDAQYGLGGWRSVADLTARDAIPSDRREEGMAVYVASEEKQYRLVNGITNSDWEEFASAVVDSGVAYGLTGLESKQILYGDTDGDFAQSADLTKESNGLLINRSGNFTDCSLQAENTSSTGNIPTSTQLQGNGAFLYSSDSAANYTSLSMYVRDSQTAKGMLAFERQSDYNGDFVWRIGGSGSSEEKMRLTYDDGLHIGSSAYGVTGVIDLENEIRIGDTKFTSYTEAGVGTWFCGARVTADETFNAHIPDRLNAYSTVFTAGTTGIAGPKIEIEDALGTSTDQYIEIAAPVVLSAQDDALDLRSGQLTTRLKGGNDSYIDYYDGTRHIRLDSYDRIIEDTAQTGVTGVLIVNDASEQNLVEGSSWSTILANSLRAGDVFEFYASGLYSTRSTPDVTISFRVKFGSTEIAKVTSAPDLSQTDKFWELKICTTVLSTGASGKVRSTGAWYWASNGAGGKDVLMVDQLNVAFDSNITIDTTVNHTVYLTADHLNADPDNSIQCNNAWMKKTEV